MSYPQGLTRNDKKVLEMLRAYDETGPSKGDEQKTVMARLLKNDPVKMAKEDAASGILKPVGFGVGYKAAKADLVGIICKEQIESDDFFSGCVPPPGDFTN